MKSIVLVSGGLDSAVVLSLARNEGDVYALSFDYGQRHRVELESARKVVAQHGPIGRSSWKYSVLDHFIVNLDGLSGGSSLTDVKQSVPKGGDSKPCPLEWTASHDAFCDEPGCEGGTIYQLKKEWRGEDQGGDTCARCCGTGKRQSVPTTPTDGIPSTYVPARNTVFIAHALHYAERLQCDRIVIGANALDYSGYPDCRPDYIAAWNALARLATKEGDIKVVAPLINMTKAEIIKVGTELGIRFEDTHSCYDPSGDAACGNCDSCRFRAAGFRNAGVTDPTRYAP